MIRTGKKYSSTKDLGPVRGQLRAPPEASVPAALGCALVALGPKKQAIEDGDHLNYFF